MPKHPRDSDSEEGELDLESDHDEKAADMEDEDEGDFEQESEEVPEPPKKFPRLDPSVVDQMKVDFFDFLALPTFSLSIFV